MRLRRGIRRGGAQQRVERRQGRRRRGRPVLLRRGGEVRGHLGLDRVQPLLRHRLGPGIQRHPALAQPGEERFQPVRQLLHRGQVHRPGGALQAVRAAEDVAQVQRPPGLRRRQGGADGIQVFPVLHREGGQQFLAEVGHARAASSLAGAALRAGSGRPA